jgi:cyclic beta-1,2-glucan synthetase
MATSISGVAGTPAAAGFALFAACVLLAAQAGPPLVAAVAGVAGALAVAAWDLARTGRRPSPRDLAADALATGLLAASADGAARLWQTPGAWPDLLTLSGLGAGIGAALYLGASFWSLARHGSRPALGARALLLAVPYLFNLLWLPTAPHLTRELAALATPGLDLAGPAGLALGRALTLLLFNEILIVGLGWSIDRRWSRDARLHLVAVACSVHVALTPLLADLGSSALVAGLPTPLRQAAAIAAAAAAGAGLWAQTFLATGLVLDAMRGRRPTSYAAIAQWTGGLGKGAVYTGLFVLLVQAAALVVDSSAAVAVLRAAPVTAGLVGGALLFPLAKTILESFDGSRPFLGRLVDNQAEPWSLARGAVVGAGLGLALLTGLELAAGPSRFAFGALVGLLAYAGVDLARDALAVRRGLRQRPQSWRVHALGAALGAAAGGAVAWYFDAAQLEVVRQKFQAYAAIHYPTAGRPVVDYVIYPLFSKWGATNLGPVAGGVRLLYDESLSGVINWSLAAPLFGVNLVLLTALIGRSWAPLRNLASPQGLAGVAEQTVRVLRWGLWMAPVVYSFLRLAPDPTWYNQDGAVRTLVATSMAWALPPDAFRAWSLELFLGLLAYDWLRVLIWFDHMGLRVATLVNLSFVGGDALDERAARFLGHPGRGRVIPEGIRRFATWAPLLIPFYIPRGAEWDGVWAQAEQVHGSGRSLLPPSRPSSRATS